VYEILRPLIYPSMSFKSFEMIADKPTLVDSTFDSLSLGGATACYANHCYQSLIGAVRQPLSDLLLRSGLKYPKGSFTLDAVPNGDAAVKCNATHCTRYEL